MKRTSVILVNGPVLSDYRITNGYSRIKDFAREIGIDPSYYTHLVKGNRRPSPQMRERLMAVTGLSFEALFRIVPRMKRAVKRRRRRSSTPGRGCL